MGLLAALRGTPPGFAERSGIAVDLELPESFERLPLDTETTLFRIVQEALINMIDVRSALPFLCRPPLRPIRLHPLSLSFPLGSVAEYD